jgi:hypothetical protein
MTNSKRLLLKKERVRNLTPRDLRSIGGAAIVAQQIAAFRYSDHSEDSCPDSCTCVPPTTTWDCWFPVTVF